MALTPVYIIGIGVNCMHMSAKEVSRVVSEITSGLVSNSVPPPGFTADSPVTNELGAEYSNFGSINCNVDYSHWPCTYVCFNIFLTLFYFLILFFICNM